MNIKQIKTEIDNLRIRSWRLETKEGRAKARAYAFTLELLSKWDQRELAEARKHGYTQGHADAKEIYA